MKFFTGFESFVGVDFWTCLFTLCNLVILYLVMKKLLFKPVKNMIDSRQKEVDDLYDNANRAKAEAEEMRARYETRLQQANAESEALLRDANRRAQLREEEILRDAQDKAAQTMQRAEAQVALEKKRAMNEIKDDVSDMAVSTVTPPPLATLALTYSTVAAALVSASVGVFTPVSFVGLLVSTSEISSV